MQVVDDAVACMYKYYLSKSTDVLSQQSIYGRGRLLSGELLSGGLLSTLCICVEFDKKYLRILARLSLSGILLSHVEDLTDTLLI